MMTKARMMTAASGLFAHTHLVCCSASWRSRVETFSCVLVSKTSFLLRFLS